MKRTLGLHFLLLGISAISGYLMSQMSAIGRLGINLMHKELKFLQVWWQGALVVYVVLFALYVAQSIFHKILPIAVARFLHIVLFGAAIAGLYFTYNDFADDFSHKLMKQRFHLGAYLFWFGWMVICVYFTFLPGEKATNKGSKGAVNP